MEVMIPIWWIGACFLPAYVANEKQRSLWGWFFISVLLSPLLGLLALCALPKPEPALIKPISEIELAAARGTYGGAAGHEVR